MIDAEVIQNLAMAISEPRSAQPGAVPTVVVPNGANLQGLEQFLERPHRKRGFANCDDVAGFAEYVNLHSLPHETRIFAAESPLGVVFVAILDHHEAQVANDNGQPGWCQHKAQFQPQFDEDFAAWVKIASGDFVSQRDFAEFIEEHAGQIHLPASAVVLEVATDLAAKTDVEFRSAVNLHNGTSQLHYEEKLEAGTGKNAVMVPQKLVLALPVYRHGVAYKMDVRLRIRIGSGEVSFKLRIVDLHLLLRHVNTQLIAEIAQATKTNVIRGRWQ